MCGVSQCRICTHVPQTSFLCAVQMPWDKFKEAGFEKIDICDRTTKDDLRLDVEEDMGSCGIVLGSVIGLARFFCLCQGLCTIYFGSSSSEKTKSHQRGCSRCCGGSDAVDAV